MPTYEYQCETCGLVQDRFFKIADRPEEIKCSCGGKMKFCLSAPMIQCDEVVNVPWLQDFARTRKEARFGHRPIQTRTEYKQYLKDNNLRDPHKGENLTEI